MAVSIEIKDGDVTATGSLRHVITDSEVKDFGIGDSALKNAVQAYFGKRPNDAYLKSPTPWNDLYKTYGWPQVQTELVVQSSTVTEKGSHPVMLNYKNFVNNSSGEATYTASMSSQRTNSVSTGWSNTHSIKFEQKITFKAAVSSETSLSYEYAFGQNGSKSETTTLSSGSGVTVVVPAHQTKHAILTCSKGHMKVRIVYEVYVRGDTAVNYNPRYKGHHFWGLNIAAVMRSGAITNKIIVTEDIVLDYYSNSTIEIGDGPAPSNLSALKVEETSGVDIISIPL